MTGWLHVAAWVSGQRGVFGDKSTTSSLRLILVDPVIASGGVIAVFDPQSLESNLTSYRGVNWFRVSVAIRRTQIVTSLMSTCDWRRQILRT